MSIDGRNVRGLVRAIAYDVRGARLGRVAQVFLDDRSDEPAWVAVDVTRTRGMRLLPLAGAALKGRHLVIRAERSTVVSAPRIDLGDGQLSSQDESRLLEHYGLRPPSGEVSPETGEQRPTSPWPDDNERETAWERPAQHRDAHDAPAAAQGWDQSTGARDTAGQGQHEAPAAVQQRDTLPSVTSDGPTPSTGPAAPVSPAPPTGPPPPVAPADGAGSTAPRPAGESPTR